MRLDVVAYFMVITIAYAENFVNMEMKNLVFAKTGLFHERFLKV